MKIKVMVVQKSFPNYRKSIFDRLNETYDFILLHSKTNSDIKEHKEEYSKEIKKIKYGSKVTNVYLHILPELLKFKPDVVIHEFTPSILSLYIIYIIRIFYKYKIILWGHGFNRSQKLEKKRVYYIRKLLIRKADSVIFYGEENKNLINSLIPSNKYFVANNSLDTYELGKIYQFLKKQGVVKIKYELRIRNIYNIIFIGRLLEEKVLTNHFLSVIQKVQRKIDDVGVIIIGDGPARKILKEKIIEYGVKNIQFLGSIHDNILTGKFLLVADILLMPGYVGLAVNHAFAFRTPVITFAEGKNGPYHSPEIEYVSNKKTGYLAKPFDTNDMSNFIIEYLSNPNMQSMMKNEINKCLIEKCNIDKMKKGFDGAINYSLQNEKK